MPATPPDPPGPESSVDSEPGPVWVGRPVDKAALIAVLVALVLVMAGLAALAATGGQPPGMERLTPGTVLAPASVTAPGSAAATPPDLVAADDFSAPALDPRWGLYHSTSPIGGVWSPDMVTVADGALTIRGVGRAPTGAGNTSGGLCWCSGGGNRLYGRWEVRARFDAGSGYGQTIGLWPESDRPADGTITLANTREPDRRRLRVAVVWYDGSRHADEKVLTGDYTGWHTYGALWRENLVQITIDGVVVYDSARRPVRVAVPRVPLHLILQQTIGPYEGVPAPNASTPAEVNTTVDWVALYR